MNIQWNAEGYTRNFSFVHQYGSDLFSLIEGQGLSVLDLGCGNGALTYQLRQAGFDAQGLDASPELLETARELWPDVPFRLGDAVNFRLSAPVDVVFSNAVLHWIDGNRQDGALRCVSRALKGGGQFIFEMGGYGNNALIHGALDRAFSRRGLVYQMPFYFPTVGQYASRLEAAGFKVAYATLFDRPTPLNGSDGLYDWLCMFIKTPFAGMEPAEREAILREVTENLREPLFRDGVWLCDYVRLRCKAVKEKKRKSEYLKGMNAMSAPHVCILQTSFAKREDTVAFLKEKVPGVRVEFITDSTLLSDVRANGGPTQAVIDRMTLYAKAAEISGADLIVNSCSTVGEVADIYAREVNVPVMKIDLPMAQEAVRLGTKIALIATLETTLGPSQRLIEKVGAGQGKKMECTQFLQNPAWDALQAGRPEEHNRILMESIRELDRQGYDAIVMAQVSMRALLPDLKDVKTPLLCSFYSGYGAIADRLNEIAAQK